MLLGVLALPAIGFFFVSYRKVLARSVVTQIALGALLGGALGNMWDRIHIGFVNVNAERAKCSPVAANHI